MCGVRGKCLKWGSGGLGGLYILSVACMCRVICIWFSCVGIELTRRRLTDITRRRPRIASMSWTRMTASLGWMADSPTGCAATGVATGTR